MKTAGLLLTGERYWDAACTMRVRQLISRPRRLVPPALLAVGSARDDSWQPLASGLGVERAPQSGPQVPPEEDGIFRAVGRRRRFPAPGFWSDATDGLLFLFRLHGFAELARYVAGARSAAGDRFWETVLADWIRLHQRPTRVAWHPYPMSGRLVTWCAALSDDWDETLAGALRRSMRRQLLVLRRSIEHDIGGNHVLHNAFALVVAGTCLGDARSEAVGWRLLESEMRDQILSDGGHEERSTAYHREILERVGDVETLLGRAGREPPEWLSAGVLRMRSWLDAVAGPAGDVPLLNDAWEGPRLSFGRRDAITDLTDSGYVVLRHNRDQALLDVGPFAAPHLPAHGHADALSFVLWIDGAPIVVDRGSYTYAGPERRRFRGTAAHNTVTVDGKDQCDLWGPFRAARTPRVRRLSTERSGSAVSLVAEHDGYRPLGVIHRRTFVWVPGAGAVVIDRLIGRACDASSRLHVAPGIDATATAVGPLEVRPLGEGGPIVAETDRHAPFLGTSVPARVLTRKGPGTPARPFGWSLLRAGSRAVLNGAHVEIEPAQGDPFTIPVG